MTCEHPDSSRNAYGKCRDCRNARERNARALGVKRPHVRTITPESRAATRTRGRKYAAALRTAALAHYGAQCECCGTTHAQHLVIDHMNGGGNTHRRVTGNGTGFYRWLRANGYPEGFQTLCHNCNFAKSAYGHCNCTR